MTRAQLFITTTYKSVTFSVLRTCNTAVGPHSGLFDHPPQQGSGGGD